MAILENYNLLNKYLEILSGYINSEMWYTKTWEGISDHLQIALRYINSENGAQKHGRISDHFRITSGYINLEIWCTIFRNFLVKKVANVYEFGGGERCTTLMILR